MASDVSEAESSAPYSHAFVVSPDDSVDLAHTTRAIYVGVGAGGTLKVITTGGETVTFSGVVTGSIIAVRASRIFNIGTTVTTMLGLY